MTVLLRCLIKSVYALAIAWQVYFYHVAIFAKPITHTYSDVLFILGVLWFFFSILAFVSRGKLRILCAAAYAFVLIITALQFFPLTCWLTYGDIDFSYLNRIMHCGMLGLMSHVLFTLFSIFFILKPDYYRLAEKYPYLKQRMKK